MLHIEEKEAEKIQRLLRDEKTGFLERGNHQKFIYCACIMGCLQLTYQKNNFLQVVHRKNGQVQKKNALDYFSGGMAMPNRQIVGGEPYRYGYQGQELDPETGKPAFQLRLYDPRINRWLTTDPAGQYHSPYMAMGNNWLNGVDADGAEYNPVYDKNGEYLGTTASGFTGEALIMDAKDFTQGMSDKSAFSMGTFLSDFNGSSQLQDLIQTHIANFKLGDGLDVGGGGIHIHASNKVGEQTPYTAEYGSKDDLLILRNKNSNRFFEPTVENIRSAVNNHEVKGHLLLGLSAEKTDHLAVYAMQIKHKDFNSTTRRFKQLTLGAYYGQGGRNFKNLYNKYGSIYTQRTWDYYKDKIKSHWDIYK